VIPKGLLQAPAGASAAGQIASHRLSALSAAVVGVFCDHYGRAPADARTLQYEEHVITVLQGGLTPVGATISRQAFHQAMNHELLRSAERTLGRRVLSHRSSIHPEARISFEIFLLADEGAER
jgi:uncharacterized protein YbcI